jgi:hypothetical protein
MPKLPRALAWLLTAITILVTLVYFRSASLAQADSILLAMFHPNQIVLPLWADGIANRLRVPIAFFEVFQAANFTAHYLCLLLLFAPLAVLLPNPAMQPERVRPTFAMAFSLAPMLWLTLGWLGEPRTFLYFQF